jgi:hypothetical protein
MTLSKIRTLVARYHQKDVASLTIDGVDFFLETVNQVRRDAEKLNSFESARCYAKIDVDGVLGEKLSNAVVYPTGVFRSIKEIIAASVLRNNNSWIPVDFTRADIELERERSELELNNWSWPVNRYPSDADIQNLTGYQKLVQRGDSLFIFPETVGDNPSVPQRVTFKLECYGFLSDYDEADYQDEDEFDYFLEHGSNFLKWAVIDELNPLFETFVPRQEGNIVTSPKDKKDEAWRDLLLWDAYRIDSHITRTK